MDVNNFRSDTEQANYAYDNGGALMLLEEGQAITFCPGKQAKQKALKTAMNNPQAYVFQVWVGQWRTDVFQVHDLPRAYWATLTEKEKEKMTAKKDREEQLAKFLTSYKTLLGVKNSHAK